MVKMIYTVMSRDGKWNSSWMYSPESAKDAFIRNKQRQGDPGTWEEFQSRGYRVVYFVATKAATLEYDDWVYEPGMEPEE